MGEGRSTSAVSKREWSRMLRFGKPRLKPMFSLIFPPQSLSMDGEWIAGNYYFSLSLFFFAFFCFPLLSFFLSVFLPSFSSVLELGSPDLF